MWRQEERRLWKLDNGSVTGTARITEIRGGYRVTVQVQDEEFGMDIVDEREFFELENDAREFLQDQMQQTLPDD
jgi:antitoxin component of MazEF toxin-antitoxin module